MGIFARSQARRFGMQTDWPSTDPDVRRYFKALVEEHARGIAQMPNHGADSDQSWHWVEAVAVLHKNAADRVANLWRARSRLEMARARKAAVKQLGTMLRIRGALIESWWVADRMNMTRVGASAGFPIVDEWNYAFTCTLHSATPGVPGMDGVLQYKWPEHNFQRVRVDDGEEFEATWQARDVLSVEGDRYEGFVLNLNATTGWSKVEVCGRTGNFTRNFFAKPDTKIELAKPREDKNPAVHFAEVMLSTRNALLREGLTSESDTLRAAQSVINEYHQQTGIRPANDREDV
ncbi:hypothetical protein F2B00_25550 [Streptomyces parvus]|uniref:hypothetical protein n=1 Tax=Streptomyces parvus TaxID=66428 RepID=UPI000A23ABA8|nr:hypothetical protein [Streptomyces parvus]KAA6199471.1 hypothetical protein F2B00_25550 [Streptomyces parvus]OSC70315.1 hypothetical protein B5180_24940 [Streptomyces sp. BF-3]GGS50915.1 hypothetical protein GCM10010221_57540 [Streptomyces parvus]